MRCRVCGEVMKVREQAFIKATYDSIVTEKPMEFKGKQMPIYECANCTHKQIDYALEEDYYQEHNSQTEGNAQYFGNLRKEKSFIEKLKKYANGTTLLEIGCGNGNFLREAEPYFDMLTGVEPSNAYFLKNTKKITYKRGYFDENLHLSYQYDYIVSFQVFEHMTELDSAMQKIKALLKDDGVCLLNVPNGLKIFQSSLYHQVLLQHVNYFTPYSIAYMVKKHGFDLLAIEDDDLACELNVYFKKNKKQHLMSEKENQISKQLLHHLRNIKNIVIWGAGRKAPSFCNGIKNDIDIVNIVDSDANKWGKYIEGMTLPIENPTKSIIDNAEAILIVAATYSVEIISTLKNKYNFQGKILYIDDDGVKIG